MMKYDKDSKAVYLMFSNGMSVRTETDGTCSITLQKNSPLIANMAGVCGNANGYVDGN